MLDLIVTKPFGTYKKGDRISDATAIKGALEENRTYVVQVQPEKSAEKTVKSK